MADLDTLKTRLTEAETAYHKLMTGAQEVTVGYGETRVTYSESSAKKLKAYIAELEDAVTVAEGGTAANAVRRAQVVQS